MIDRKQRAFKRGFTLLELLVVIAIIGVMSAVIIYFVNASRTRGKDSAIVTQMKSMQSQAELYYISNNRVYSANGTDPSGMCGVAPVGGNSNVFEFGTNNMSKLIDNIEKQIGVTLSPANSICNAKDSAWVAAFTLPGGGVYCTDSTGRLTNKTTGGTLYTTISSAVSSGTHICL